MSSPPPYRLTATQAAAQIRSGALTVEDYAKSILSRIEERDEQVGAWAYLNPEQVLAQARQLDQLPPAQRGPLHGVAVAVKDIIYTKDMPTQHASPLYAAHAPALDAGSVAILRAAGALLLGKTTTPEFAAVTDGPPRTRNPHDARRTPGGSSTGSGAAVADGQAAVALGTQTGGSVIRPGAFNGVWALKPTWGAVTREGQKTYSVNLDTLGWYARAAEDLEMVAEVFGVRDDEEEEGSGPAGAWSVEEVRGRRFGILKTMQWDANVQPATVAAMEKAAALLRAHGAEVEEVALPADLDELPRWHAVVLAADGRAAFLPEYRTATAGGGGGSQGEGGGPLLLHKQLIGHVENVEGFSRAEHLRALDSIAAARPRVDALLEGYAAVLTPSVPGEAPVGIEKTGSPAFNLIWTVSVTSVLVFAILRLTIMDFLVVFLFCSPVKANLSVSTRLYMFPSSTFLDLEGRTECRSECPWWRLDTETGDCWRCPRQWARYSRRRGVGGRSCDVTPRGST